MSQTVFRNLLCGGIAAASIFQNTSFASHDHTAGADAPIGIMDSHVHPEGSWMMSYSVMQMTMKDNLDGADRASVPLPGYMVSPLSMDMTMHMLGLMYGYTDRLTLMIMLPVKNYSMENMVNMSGDLFTAESSGAGDLSLSALYKASDNWVSKIGISVPTGSIDEKDVLPSSGGNAVQLPYPMQQGSGSFDITAAASYLKNKNMNSWGSQAEAVIRLNDNDRDYRLGNQIELNGWYSYGLSMKSSLSLRVKLLSWGNIRGADVALNPGAVPTADSKLRAGTRADVLLGFNYNLSSDVLIGVEAGIPVYQKLDGPQLETDLVMQLGLQYSL
ncbi:hypothetical protein MNBD_GAMMA09-1929 [hydrothermal vent metagenome]|uniref:Transporter n=1 Tax=hydrothermal vent metagenome TaxID=652676 RepID=A0A3B0YKS7_9ZZZZ